MVGFFNSDDDDSTLLLLFTFEGAAESKASIAPKGFGFESVLVIEPGSVKLIVDGIFFNIDIWKWKI